MYLYYPIRSLLSTIFFIIKYNLPHFQCRLSVSAPLKRLNQLFTPRRYEVFTLYLSETVMTFPSHGSIATKSDTEIPLPPPVFFTADDRYPVLWCISGYVKNRRFPAINSLYAAAKQLPLKRKISSYSHLCSTRSLHL